MQLLFVNIFRITLYIFILSACKKNNNNEITNIFENYLKEQCHCKMYQDMHYYLILHLKTCDACGLDIINEIKKNEINKNITVIIASSGRKIDDKIKIAIQKTNACTDKKDMISRSGIGIIGHTLLITKNKKIDSIIYIKPDNFDWVLRELKIK